MLFRQGDPMEVKTENTYQPPKIESIITQEELEREIHYAGAVS